MSSILVLHVYLLQYPVSVIIISETMKITQHQEVDSEYLYDNILYTIYCFIMEQIIIKY
jgi:hypothetical protein